MKEKLPDYTAAVFAAINDIGIGKSIKATELLEGINPRINYSGSRDEIVEIFRHFSCPVRIYSGNYEAVDVVENPKVSVFFDEGNYNLGDKCGIMMGVFLGANPQFEDYLWSGILIPTTKSLFLATFEEGSFVFVIDPVGLGVQPPPVKIFLSSDTAGKFRICANMFCATSYSLAERLCDTGNYEVSYMRSMPAICFADFLLGGFDAILCTGKERLKIAAACGLIIEAGGVIRTLNGEDLLDQKILEFGKGQEEIPIVVAANEEIAANVLEVLNA